MSNFQKVLEPMPEIVNRLKNEGNYGLITEKIVKYYKHIFKSIEDLKKYEEIYMDFFKFRKDISIELRTELKMLGNIKNWDVSELTFTSLSDLEHYMNLLTNTKKWNFKFLSKDDLRNALFYYVECKNNNCSQTMKKVINSLGKIDNWDISNIDDMSNLPSFPVNQETGNEFDEQMPNFEPDYMHFHKDFVGMKNWDIAHVKNMEGMFYDLDLRKYGETLIKIIEQWEPEYLENMKYFTGEDNGQSYKFFDNSDYGGNEMWAILMGSKKGYSIYKHGKIWEDDRLI